MNWVKFQPSSPCSSGSTFPRINLCMPVRQLLTKPRTWTSVINMSNFAGFTHSISPELFQAFFFTSSDHGTANSFRLQFSCLVSRTRSSSPATPGWRGNAPSQVVMASLITALASIWQTSSFRFLVGASRQLLHYLLLLHHALDGQEGRDLASLANALQGKAAITHFIAISHTMGDILALFLVLAVNSMTQFRHSLGSISAWTPLAFHKLSVYILAFFLFLVMKFMTAFQNSSEANLCLSSSVSAMLAARSAGTCERRMRRLHANTDCV